VSQLRDPSTPPLVRQKRAPTPRRGDTNTGCGPDRLQFGRRRCHSLGREPRQGDGDGVASVSVNEERSLMCAPRIKCALALTLLVGLAVLCGCAHQYLMKLSDGDQIISLNKPKLQGTVYCFTNGTGQPDMIPQSHVVKIQAVSIAKEEQKPLFPPKPKKPTHWYFLWLA
jgi:hypothetical protein